MVYVGNGYRYVWYGVEPEGNSLSLEIEWKQERSVSNGNIIGKRKLRNSLYLFIVSFSQTE